ncbi:UDP-N-acetylmuramoyl-L-alanyl-D-glutamate--2,6-diaminopimelate ligase [Kocuria palustris]|uniref:UDP-N-acetylmuramoyl-L-alanyl-D-glutamate--2, 6-diaminopimelate ligase n=1 Tax=Kocuria palustris TaxID=71999 RepID=UPI0023012CC7|nr:UDP-N-acetylmuramoyl-L-alanyl-D-glutamate--2,6-diaminopimelate ligase [Kocuria palustris]
MQNLPEPGLDAARLRPRSAASLPAAELAQLIGARLELPEAHRGAQEPASLRGISIDSRSVQPGDLYAALPGARFHGAGFAAAAIGSGAAAVLTDQAGLQLMLDDGPLSVPVIVAAVPREHMGQISAALYGGSEDERARMPLFGVTGTNGKTTTTYFLNSIQKALGRTTGLIGTIEILAGDQRIPSLLTTPEAPSVHALLAVMREAGMTGASMEVSSHALEFHRVDGVHYDVTGFTNLTQDHLDLHGSMEGYFEVKAQLFTARRTDRAVIVVADDQDEWGLRMARRAREELGAEKVEVIALRGGIVEDRDSGPQRHGADWTLRALARRGVGHRFELVHRDGRRLRVSTGLPGEFNVANAALAVVMVLASGVPLQVLQDVLDDQDPLTTDVPGRMQLIASEPTAVVDFAHNPDALTRALEAVDPPEGDGRVIVVFGATGQRDTTKRPLMGRIAAQGADVVIVTDDDPHDEDPAGIRAEVIAGARQARDEGAARATEIEEIHPRATAIRTAAAMAGPRDSILVAGRGHETTQEIAGVDHPLDDRQELRDALHDTQEGRWGRS